MPIESTAPIWSPFYITDAGYALRQRVIAEGGTVHWAGAAVGEGVPSSILQIGKMIDLVSYTYPAIIKRSFSQEANHIMVIEMNNQKPMEYEREVLVREVGVYAQYGDSDTLILYGYAYALSGHATMPPGASSNQAHQLVFDSKIQNTSDVTIVYDGSAIYMSHDEFNKALAVINGDLDGMQLAIDAINAQLPNKVNLGSPEKNPLVLFHEQYQPVQAMSHECCYYKTQDNRVTIEFAISMKSGEDFEIQTYAVAMLPVGFRSSNYKHTAGYGTFVGAQGFIAIYTTPDGLLHLTPTQPCTALLGQISYIADS